MPHDLSRPERPVGRRAPGTQAIEIPSIEPAKDGWVGFCTITGQQWVDFCSLIGHPEVGKDDRFLDAKNAHGSTSPFMQEIIHELDARAHGRRDRRARER